MAATQKWSRVPMYCRCITMYCYCTVRMHGCVLQVCNVLSISVNTCLLYISSTVLWRTFRESVYDTASMSISRGYTCLASVCITATCTVYCQSMYAAS